MIIHLDKETWAYIYIGATVFLVIVLYSYIAHLYRSEKKGHSYEKYADLALNDGINDKIIEERDNKKRS